MQQNELQHYGVVGMKWGVRRATKTLSSSSATDDKKKKAVASLNKHRDKATKKVAKLEKQGVKLEKAYNKAVLKTNPKIAKIDRQIAKIDRKLNSRPHVSDRKARKLLMDQTALNMKVNDLKAKSGKAKAAYAKNERIKELFNKGISDIDSTIASRGRKYING